MRAVDGDLGCQCFFLKALPVSDQIREDSRELYGNGCRLINRIFGQCLINVNENGGGRELQVRHDAVTYSKTAKKGHVGFKWSLERNE